jgi:hypothetical protein
MKTPVRRYLPELLGAAIGAGIVLPFGGPIIALIALAVSFAVMVAIDRWTYR